jgi:hypothetical protein
LVFKLFLRLFSCDSDRGWSVTRPFVVTFALRQRIDLGMSLEPVRAAEVR